MPSNSKKPRVRVRRKVFDAQSTFQMERHEKKAINSLIDGRRFRYEGDVLREAMDLLFKKYNIDPEKFKES